MKSVSFLDATWLNKPAICHVEANRVQVTTDAGTDFWRDTFYGFRRDTGHFLWVATGAEFTAELCVRAAYESLYDQAGLMVRIDETVWCKCGIEFTDGRMMASSVLTNGSSDWAISPLPIDAPALWLRVVVSKGAIQIRVSQNQRDWTMLRLGPFPVASVVQAGPTCCTPERSGLVAEFTDLAIGPPSEAGLHDG